ncbi:MAG: beta-galactosidase [bacterium]|nr:beta-galactosidase [bacterium]
MAYWWLLVLCLLIGATLGASAQQVLFDFEHEAQLQPLVRNNVQAQRVSAGGKLSGRALEVEFHPAEWPNVMFRPAQPWNWTGAGALAIDIHNPNPEPVWLGIRVDDDPRADGWNHCRQATTTIGAGETQTYVVPLAFNPMDYGMRGLPPLVQGGGVLLGVTNPHKLNVNHIVAFQVFLHRPPKPVKLQIDNIRLIEGSAPVKGIVDRFGQWAGGDWPGKVKSEDDLRRRRQQEEQELRWIPALPDRDEYGGWKSGPKLQATGYFRAAKHGGKWWLVTPAGTLFVSLGMDCVHTGDATFIAGREEMFTWLPEEGSALARHIGYHSGIHSGPVKEGKTINWYALNLQRKYGENYKPVWMDVTLRRLHSWGFNTIANWSDWDFHRNGKVPYVGTAHVGGDHARVASGNDYWGKMHDPFDPRFEQSVRNALRPVTQRIGDDPWCIGYFVDNELSWAGTGEEGGRYGLAYGALQEDAANSPAKRAFVQQLRQKYERIERLNAAWGASFTSWEELEKPQRLQPPSNDARRQDFAEFVKSLARQYFRTVRNVLKELAPNHLYLGCRFAWYGPDAVEAAAEYCDVISFNIYAPRVERERYAIVEKLDKPAIIGEFHFGALDRGMFHTGLVAAKDQQDRARMYKDYLTSVLTHPNFVGCHWFQYNDQPLTGRWFDGENYNIGFVTITDTPYPEMVQAAREIHGEAYRIRSGTAR